MTRAGMVGMPGGWPMGLGIKDRLDLESRCLIEDYVLEGGGGRGCLCMTPLSGLPFPRTGPGARNYRAGAAKYASPVSTP